MESLALFPVMEKANLSVQMADSWHRLLSNLTAHVKVESRGFNVLAETWRSGERKDYMSLQKKP